MTRARPRPACPGAVSISLLCAWAALGCASQVSAGNVRAALDGMSEQDRLHVFEVTAAALDTRLRYVDQFYAIARRHPAMFRRFLANTARDLEQHALATATVEQLVQHPASLERVMVTTLDLGAADAEGRPVIVRSIVRRRAVVAELLADHPQALEAVLLATVERVDRKPKARAALCRAMGRSANTLAAILVEQPDTTKTLIEAMIDAGMPRALLVDSVKDILPGSD